MLRKERTKTGAEGKEVTCSISELWLAVAIFAHLQEENVILKHILSE